MNLSNNLQQFMIKQAMSEKDLAQIAAVLAKAEAEEKKRKKRPIGPSYGKRFLRGAGVGAPYGAILGGVIGSQTDDPLAGAGVGALGGGLAGGLGGGLSNMLAAYLQGDMYDAIAASK